MRTVKINPPTPIEEVFVGNYKTENKFYYRIVRSKPYFDNLLRLLSMDGLCIDDGGDQGYRQNYINTDSLRYALKTYVTKCPDPLYLYYMTIHQSLLYTLDAADEMLEVGSVEHWQAVNTLFGGFVSTVAEREIMKRQKTLLPDSQLPDPNKDQDNDEAYVGFLFSHSAGWWIAHKNQITGEGLTIAEAVSDWKTRSVPRFRAIQLGVIHTAGYDLLDVVQVAEDKVQLYLCNNRNDEAKAGPSLTVDEWKGCLMKMMSFRPTKIKIQEHA